MRPAAVAELVDAQASGACALRGVEVQVLSAALGGPDRSRAGRLDRAQLPRQEVDHPLRNDRAGADLIVRSGDDGGSDLLPWNPYRDRGRLWPRKPHRNYQGGGGDLVRATTRPRGCEAQLECLMSEGGEVNAVERVGGRRGPQRCGRAVWASDYGRAGLDRNDRWRDCTLGGIDRVRVMMERFMT